MLNKQILKKELTTTAMWYGFIMLFKGLVHLELIPFCRSRSSSVNRLDGELE